VSQSVFFMRKKEKVFNVAINVKHLFIASKPIKQNEKKRKEKRHSKRRNAGRNKPSVCSFQTVLDTVDTKPTVFR
jgi:hypothetical protein